MISPLFREMPLRIPSLGRGRARLPLWALLIHLRWRTRERRRSYAPLSVWELAPIEASLRPLADER